MDEAKPAVLMIDDEADIVGFFSKAFTAFKHIKFLAVNRADKALEIARDELPAVILIDLRMPGMNGEEAIPKLKALSPGSRIVVMTGCVEGHVQEHVESLGISAYYSKPVDLEKVIAKVMSLIMVKGN